mgnify:FL=1
MALSTIRSLLSPNLDLVQIDATTRGTWEGTFTIRRAYRDRWLMRDFNPEMMRGLRPVLKRTRICHLQGWGEPLLNPHFFDLARIAAECGCTVTTAFSDGSLVDESAARELTDCGLSQITLSISSLADQENFERRGTKLSAAFQALDEIRRHRNTFGDKTPHINVLYNLHRSDLGELQKLPAIFQGLDVETLIINPLAFTPGVENEDQALVPGGPDELEELRKKVRETTELAEKRGMRVIAFAVNGGKKPPRCIEKLNSGMFVDSAGNVSPCIFSSPPIRGEAEYRFQGMDIPFPRLNFGNLEQASFRRIWHHEPYREFRRQFKKHGVPEACAGCWRPYIDLVQA